MAQLDLHKLGGFSPSQRAMVAGQQQMADDLLDFYLQQATLDTGSGHWLLLGSKRGFCGDFNEALLQRLE